MKLFELLDNPNNVKCLIIGGHHGNEPIGVDICKKLTKMIPSRNGLHIIPMANRPAFIEKTRDFNDIDLNRAYGTEPTNILELDNMVKIIKDKAKNAMVVIDCHSTPITGLDEISVYPNNNAIEIAPLMGLPFYVHRSPENSLRYYCDSHDVPAITFEGIDELHEESVAAGVAGIMKLLTSLKLI